MARQNLENGETLGTHRGKVNQNFTELYSIKVEYSAVLIKTNTNPYTPTADYHPATKLYADNLRVTWEAVYDPQSIAGDTFDRANHTGQIAPAVVATDADNRFITDAERSDWNQKEDDLGAKNTAFNKNFGTGSGTVSEGDHNHTTEYEPKNANIQTHVTTVTGNPHGTVKNDIGLGNVDNTADVDKPVSTATQTALDLKANADEVYTQAQLDLALADKQGIATLQADVSAINATAEVHFSKYRDTKAVIADYDVLLSDDTLIVAATAADITITLPLLSTLTDLPYQVLEIIPVVANGFTVRIATQGSDTFPFGNTWFDLPFSQKQFAIGLHEHGFNLRRNISIMGEYHLDITPWNSSNFATATAIPWEHEDRNTQTELIEWSVGDAGKIYVRTTGSYTVSLGVNISPASVQSWEVEAAIYVNGVVVGHMAMTEGGEGNNNSSIYAASVVDLDEDDYIELRLEHSGTAAVNITSANLILSIRL